MYKLFIKMDYWLTKILPFILFTNVYSQQFFNTMPPPVNTNFTCQGRDTGFYADFETNCRVYHTCDENGNKFTYYCPAETAFRQEALVCDHAHLVDCANGRRISKIEQTMPDNNRESSEKNIDNDKRYSSTKIASFNRNAKGGAQRTDSFQPGNSNSDYRRSFTITQESRESQFSTQKTPSGQQKPTFVLSSSVFLRDMTNLQKNPSLSRNNRVSTSDDAKSFDNSEKSPNDDSKKKEESRVRYSTIFPFPTSTTLSRSFGADFKAKQYPRDPMILRSSIFVKKDESTESYIDKFFSTTTARPSVRFDENYRIRDSSDERRSYEKFKLIYPNNNGENVGNSGSRTMLRNENTRTSEAPAEFQFDEKRMRDKGIETSDIFQVHSTNGNEELESASPRKIQDVVGEYMENVRKDSMGSKNWESYDKNSKELKISIHERPPFFHDNSNFPYSETLRSMQAMTVKSLSKNLTKFNYSNYSTTTSSPITTAGTEFPVYPFAGTLSPLGPNEFDDDPYYPKRSTTTELYYKLSDLHGDEKKPLRFSIKRPSPGNLNFEIPEVLPDLNTLDDLVDRRKYFYIPRIKAI